MLDSCGIAIFNTHTFVTTLLGATVHFIVIQFNGSATDSTLGQTVRFSLLLKLSRKAYIQVIFIYMTVVTL